ncbi:GNAT family N-acetyltransferase [Micromonospora sp. CA-263727]|uniref:GNAT family N-acetyltransferase n=1 Tax=Micromonospora sp. CA-263727 TaxID=3239967 RepID=UPI003D8E6105
MEAWLPAPLDAGRVSLRRPGPDDLAGLVALLTDGEVRRYLGGPVERRTAERRAVRLVSEPAWGQFVIVDRVTDELVGSDDLSRKRGPWEISYQLSYQLRPSSWGMGLASETLSAVLDWYFATMGEDF